MVPNIRVNVGAPFPATVKGGGPVAITKQANIWTVTLQFVGLTALPPGTDPTQVYLLVYNNLAGVFQQTTLAALLSTNAPATIVTHAMSPYPPTAADTFLLVDTTGGAVEIDMPLAAQRNGISLLIKDDKGSAAGNNITIKPTAPETIDGFTNAAPLVINGNYDGVNLRPAAAHYVIAP
jgi:hypothetical protein